MTRRPESIWSELGSVDGLTLLDIREALELQQLEAFLVGEKVLKIPHPVVQRIHHHLVHASQTLEESVDMWLKPPMVGKGRPRKTWRTARFHELAKEQFRQRKSELKAMGMAVEDAETQSGDEVAHAHMMGASTLIQRSKSKLK
ncbi:hypothetical protein J5289_16270 [Rhizobium sp. B230/85]|uniref:hypothetical protein n=1 Tax=unclassified Rhizobium TaxID=2613769 RepID=UPI001ADA226D|nr:MULTISPECIES: hypothetical protein [unclassified Rhizobium]MBO9131720.1 hypothetical protein [Rhizobium sp. B209b/85]QXZ95712.1 hypothetical protein J5289_16270 [Rhizobium sp. B230/85]